MKPYQPDGLWEAVAMLDSNTRLLSSRTHGDKLYRRSLYTFWKRSAPPASMDIFNAPSRENCTVRRERTNTPLQALVTMNDHAVCRSCAAPCRHGNRPGAARTFDARLDFITNHALARPFDVKERADRRNHTPSSSTTTTRIPPTRRNSSRSASRSPNVTLSATELAAMTMLANQMLNLDEVLNK